MADLNYHHLRYFHEVARDGNLTRTAERLNLSQSALSTQIRHLEARLGHDLFERRGRGLVLTELGRIALDHAERIFGIGADLLATLRREGAGGASLRIGALSTLSRNFQLLFLQPVLGRTDVDLILRSGSAPLMLEALAALELDAVLTTEPPARVAGTRLLAHRIDAQPVQIYGAAHRLGHPSLADLLAAQAVILPTESSIRTGFDSLVARLGVAPRVAAEVDDMAMVRLLARADAGLAIAPAVVLADEIEAGLLQAAPFDLDVVESFYAVTLDRRFPNPLLAELLDGPGVTAG
jgi:LysR family transcriptional activator of nhaA